MRRAMKASLRGSLLRGLLWVPALLVALWALNQERADFRDARAQVARQARRAALAEGQLIQLRLMQQFQQLEFAARDIIGARDPAQLGPRSRRLLERFAAQHSELFALNLLSVAGSRIEWSSMPQSAKPIFGEREFTSLPGHPDDLLGRAAFTPRYGASILAMRYRMRDAAGHTLYFIGSPYRLDALLAMPHASRWAVAVRDLRDGRLIGAVPGAGVAAPRGGAGAGAGVEQVIDGLPLAVETAWSPSQVWAVYRQGLAWRLAARGAVLALFILAALIIARLLRGRERLLEQSAQLARFNAMRAQVNRAIVKAADVQELLQAICDLAVLDPAVSLAWIGRPGEHGSMEVLAHAGPAAAYLEGIAAGVGQQVAQQRSAEFLAWHEGRAVFSAARRDARDAAACTEERQRFGLNASASLPLRRGGQVWAVLHLYGSHADAFDPELQRTMRELADDVSSGLDRLDLLRSQAQLQQQHASLLDNAVAGVVMVRYPGALIVEANAAVARIFGVRDLRGALGKAVAEAAPTLNQPAMISATREVLGRGGVTLEALDIVREDGRPACVTLSGQRMPRDAEGATDVVWTIVDVTERQQLMQQMERLSQVDPLTGLPNRRALEFNLERAVAQAQRAGAAIAVGLIDLDDFKPVNDRWGHEVGDALLQQLGERLRALSRSTDMIARLGGDEFVLVIEDLELDYAQEQLEFILERLHQAVETPFDLGAGRLASVGMSMGLAVAPDDGASAEALLRLADAAMYRIKSRKATRAHWWARAGSAQQAQSGQESADALPEPPFDPFASDAQRLLTRVEPLFERAEREFVENFYAELAQRPDLAVILSALGPERLEGLKSSQARHLRFLLEPATSAANIQVRARHLGAVHALVGVAPSWLSASMQLYRDLLHWHLDATELAARDRHRLQRVLDARVQIDLQAQLDTMLEVQNTYNAYLARPLPRNGQGWIEVVREKLRALGTLPGIQSCALMRPDGQGMFALQACDGPQAEEMAGVLSAPGMRPSLDSGSPTGMGLAALAWRTETVMTARSYESQPGLQPWEQAARRMGVRSMAAIPLLRGGQTDAVLVIYGAYPNQFDTEQGRTFLTAVQNRWNLIDDLLRRRQPLLDQHEAARYREWLYADGLAMFVQPVVDLRAGGVAKVEALARLVSPDGRVVPPDVFLPALRDADLDALFRIGLAQSLHWLTRWREHGIEVDVSLNLPPSTMLHPECAQWIEQALRDSRVPARHLVLELLESQEVDEARRDQAVATLGRLGVRLAIDDLGSGFSSLKRLASMPFDIIKVDRAILLDIERDPIKALSLVRTVAQIGRDFEKEVVIEGVESTAIAEAASVLGVGYGQGFGIARPMPARDFGAWVAQRGAAQACAAPQRLDTALGALAFHWLYMHELQPHRDTSLQQCPLGGYLRRVGLEAREAMAWHAAVHESADADERKAASHRLSAWLIERVRKRPAAHPAESQDLQSDPA